MRILLTGASGLVGSRFVQLHDNKEELLIPDLDVFDITNPVSLKNYFAKNIPDVIIHFAAFTDVGEAEKQRDDQTGPCWKINVDGTKNLLEAVDPEKTRFIHISTDMIFSGSSDDPGPYSEDHLPETDSSKVTWYGFTKAAAESVVRSKLGSQATILRLIYPVRATFSGKLDYLRKQLKMYDDGKLLPLFTNQQVSISFIDEICQALETIITGIFFGVYHASSQNTATFYDLVSYLLLKTRNEKGPLKSWSMEDFYATGASPVRYPKFGGLKVEETEKRLGIRYSTWQEIIDKLVEQGVSV